MKRIAFVDLEVHPATKTVLDIGATNERGGILHTKRMSELGRFLAGHDYLCGHNILAHDLQYLKEVLRERPALSWNVIDTLHLSPLLFPKRPYHRLVKDEKLQHDELSNPLSDAIKAKELLDDEVLAFAKLAEPLKRIFVELLATRKEFCAFFHYLGFTTGTGDLAQAVHNHFQGHICENATIAQWANKEPVALAYALAIISTADRFSVTPKWVLMQHPQIEGVLHALRGKRCLEGCAHCDYHLDAQLGLKRIFGFDQFRLFGGEPLQQQAVEAALAGKSILAVFPTGGGKSLTFQLPALMAGESVKGLTVVVSPLQSLMKDQVDNLEKSGIVDAVAINGMLSPLERANALERLGDGSVSILYLSPETLRSRTIRSKLLGRKISRIVIDEAHCFSAWGQDFRVDYLYIGRFIRDLQRIKNLHETIPVSCFTATAKPKVIEDIRDYFKGELGLDLEIYATDTARHNLQLKASEVQNDEMKYESLRRILHEKDCPTIVYVSRTKTADDLAERLQRDGFVARAYHGRMDRTEKAEHQEQFMADEVPIIVATSAFGMGVDKRDVGLVVHYEVPNSLENYIQEAGRAGRDANIQAECHVLYCEEDLDKHFALLTQTKLDIKEIQQVWKAIKDLTKLRKKVSRSALEIARQAGWDESVEQLETKVKAAVSTLEQAGLVRRSENSTKVFADSLQVRNAMDASAIIERSHVFSPEERQDAERILQYLLSNRAVSHATGNDPMAYADYMAETLAIPQARVFTAINRLRDVGVLAFAKDCFAYLKRDDHVNKSLAVLRSFAGLESFIISQLDSDTAVYNVKQLTEDALLHGVDDASPQKIRAILNFWAITKRASCRNAPGSRNHVYIEEWKLGQPLHEVAEKRLHVARFVVEYLFQLSMSGPRVSGKDEAPVHFSMHEVKKAYDESGDLFKYPIQVEDVEDALLYLGRIKSVEVDGAFLVLYNPMIVERLESPIKRYTKDDYQQLDDYYRNRTQLIHIAGEYARKLVNDYGAAIQFVDDYFKMHFNRFLAKYFYGRSEEIARPLTPAKFKQIYGELSPAQLAIVKDSTSSYICVLAGPGSGKTRVLAHKMAALLRVENVKYEQLLMLTFSRAAATEFKSRLLQLVGPAAHFTEIKTFHSFCFDLLGKMGSLEKADRIIEETIARIEAGEVEPSRLAKMVLLIDEAQDMDAQTYALVTTLIKHNDSMRVILVGDDDQNIFAFRQSSSEFMARFVAEHGATQFELIENYRSAPNIVEVANQFASSIEGRLKKTPTVSKLTSPGEIRLVNYALGNMLTPLSVDIERVATSGTVAALTRTNEEALLLCTLLQKREVRAQLVQSSTDYKLSNLDELRFFSRLISSGESIAVGKVDDETWQLAERALREKYRRSHALGMVQRLLRAFALTHKSKYLSDFDLFVRESKAEDFYSSSTQNEAVWVSTIHKAKGKEFDHVFVMLSEGHRPSSEANRLVYVAMTRAKHSLSIHYQGDLFKDIRVDNLLRIEDRLSYEEPQDIALQLGYSDIGLNAFVGREDVYSGLQCGDEIVYKNGVWFSGDGRALFRFSQEFSEGKLAELAKKRYRPVAGKISNVLWWKPADSEHEVRIALPQIYLSKR